MSLSFLVGHWCDERGSVYDVSLDPDFAQAPASCSVKITRNDGQIKHANRAVKQTPDGRFIWNDNYVIDTDSMTDTCITWVSLLGNRSFVWTRLGEGKTPAEDVWFSILGHFSQPPSETSKDTKGWLPTDSMENKSVKSASMHAPPCHEAIEEVAARAVEASRLRKMEEVSFGRIRLEGLVGLWTNGVDSTWDVSIDAAVTRDQPSCSVVIVKAGGRSRVASGVIVLNPHGQIVWGSKYILEGNTFDSSGCARWTPVKGNNGFEWFRPKPCESHEAVLGNSGLVSKPHSRLPELVGSWFDGSGTIYQTEIDASVDEAMSCTVTIKRPDKPPHVASGVIVLKPDGQIFWNDRYVLDQHSETDVARWIPSKEGKSFVWFRNPMVSEESATVTGFDLDAVSTELPAEMQIVTGTNTKLSSQMNIAPHFCIFENMSEGLQGWSGQGDSNDSRWSSILLTMLQCVMMDGLWPQDVAASAFVGCDAVHISGAVQQIAMPPVFRNGKTKTCPATPDAWESMLWDRQGKDCPGLRWEVGGPARSSSHSAKKMLERVNAMLDRSSPDAVALVLDYKHADVTYDDLRLSASGLGSRAQDVFVLLGSSHGFGDKWAGESSLVDHILNCFKQRLGADRVVRVNLGTATTSAVPLPMPKVAAFLSTEFSRGSLAHVVSGLKNRCGTSWQ